MTVYSVDHISLFISIHIIRDQSLSQSTIEYKMAASVSDHKEYGQACKTSNRYKWGTRWINRKEPQQNLSPRSTWIITTCNMGVECHHANCLFSTLVWQTEHKYILLWYDSWGTVYKERINIWVIIHKHNINTWWWIIKLYGDVNYQNIICHWMLT